MLIKQKNINIIVLLILIWWLVFIFSNTKEETINDTQTPTTPSISQETEQEIILQPTQSPVSEEEQISTKVANKVTSTEDISILLKIYNKDKDLKVLKNLIEKLTQNYEFEQANIYLKELLSNPEYKQWFDPTLHLYLALHDTTSISITKLKSIQNLLPIMDDYKNKWQISADDYNFYFWLMKLRYKDYEWTKKLWEQITSPRYQPTIQSVTKAINDYNPEQNIPKYYQDWLVALSLLKNWYFSVAKKLSLEAALTDNKYILPYQILAYTHFLTNNRDTATQYFLKLANFDETNKDLYKFLIWISYYRSDKYDESIIYLSQVTETNLQTDTYRYLLLSYLKLQDYPKTVSLRQKLLWQTDISRSDYYTYFYNSFYLPYLNKQISNIYKENTALAQMFISNCTNTITGTDTDICTYGRIWLEIINNRLSSNIIPVLTNLAEKYNNSYLYRILWDIYLANQNSTQAKQSYAKALSISLDQKETKYLEEKISQL